jgi:hypothetical protein
MKQNAIMRTALLAVAILALATCENLAHDLHKKGGGGGAVMPGGLKAPPPPQVVYDISLTSSEGFKPVEVGYSQGEAGRVILTVTNNGAEATGALTVSLTGRDAGGFDLSRSGISSIPPGGSDSVIVTPRTGKPAGVYVIEKIAVSGGNGIRREIPGRRFGVLEDLIDLSNPVPNQFSKWAVIGDRISIQNGANVKVINDTASKYIEVESNATVNLFPVDAKIDLSGASTSAFLLNSGAKVYLSLTGDNELKTDHEYSAGLAVPAGTTLSIEGSGSLMAQSGKEGAGIGGNSGGEDCGTVTIHDGTVIAVGNNGAGIGGGEGGGNGGTIKIYGGTVAAVSTGSGAGIGGGKSVGNGGDITIFGGTVYAKGGGKSDVTGAGIGGGFGGNGGNITISGGTVYARGGGYAGAGIGGGESGKGGIITISGGTVTAMSKNFGAGIGGGGGYPHGGDGGDIIISGGTVYVLGGIVGIGNGGDISDARTIVNAGRNGSLEGGSLEGGLGGLDDDHYTDTGSGTTFGVNNGKPVIFASSMSLNGFDNPGDGIAASVDSVSITMTPATVWLNGDIGIASIRRVAVTMKKPFTIPSGSVLTVPDITRLYRDGNTLTENGRLVNHGTINPGTDGGLDDSDDIDDGIGGEYVRRIGGDLGDGR